MRPARNRGPTGDGYLIEQTSIAHIAAPQILCDLLSREKVQRPAADVMLLGGVDYDADASLAKKPAKKAFLPLLAKNSQRSGTGPLFEALSGTVGEISTIEKKYREIFAPARITTFAGAAATKDAILQNAPQHLYLYFATHGFFAPAEFQSVLSAVSRGSQAARFDLASDHSVSGYHPGLLSGIALAGANRRDDSASGILTADEVGALNLANVEMAVLSACETGLGRIAGGEGPLGLQRAFQVAGTKTVIASLWKVDDVATRDLMERFYDNLWNKDLGKLEALREAQIWMMNKRGPRGLIEVTADAKAEKEPRLPPHYWAAWVLSGDWR